ncbi:MAG: hypothetical protein RSG55_07980 [Oscillospiraceae bacterium]
MKKALKKRLIIIGSVILLFGICNLVWYLIVFDKYNDYIVGMEEIYPNRTYVIDNRDGYTYNVKIPDYLTFTGNLGIQPSGGGGFALIIWPGIFKETTYGVFISTDNGRSQAVMLTKDRMPVSDEPKQIKQLVEENRGKIDELFDKAFDLWKIN